MRQLKITKQVTNRETASLDKYLQEIGRVDLITAEEEVELAKRIKAGDQVALEKLTKANLRFVVSVSKQYQNQGLSLPDLINEGNLGLIKPLSVSMKREVSNSFPMPYGGFVSRFCRHWQSSRVLFDCRSTRLDQSIKSTRHSPSWNKSLSAHPHRPNWPRCWK